MARPLTPDRSSIAVRGKFSGNFMKAHYLRMQSSAELERRIGYGAGRLSGGWWLLFALEKPQPEYFEFGGYTHFSGARLGHPSLGNARRTVEQSLSDTLGGTAQVLKARKAHIDGLMLMGADRLAKVIPVNRGADYPVGTGIYQCNVRCDPADPAKGPIDCVVADFIPPGGRYSGMYK